MATKKTKLLKNLLTTASALAVMVGAADSALAGIQVYETTGNGATVRDAGGNTNNMQVEGTGVANPAWVAGSTVVISGDHSLATAAAATIGAIDVNGQAGGNVGFVAAHAASLGSVKDATGAGRKLNVIVNSNITLTLTGLAGVDSRAPGQAAAIGVNDYSGLGNITLGSGAGPGTLAINLTNADGAGKKKITLSGNINCNPAASDGVITVAAGNEVIFDGVLGGTKALKSLELTGDAKATFNNSATFDKAGAANMIKLGDGSVLSVTGARTLTGAANDSIDGAAAGKGKIVIDAGGLGNTVTFNNVLIGDTTIVDSVEISNGNFKTNKNIKAENGVVVKTGGTFKVDGANLVLGAGAAATNIVGGGAANAGGISMETANDLTVFGSVGTTAAPLDKIEIANGARANTLKIYGLAAGGANTLVTAKGVNFDTSALGGAAGGKIEIKAADLTIDSDIGKLGKALTEIKLVNNNAGVAGAGKVTVAANRKIYVTDFELGVGHANRLDLSAGSQIIGNVKAMDAASKLIFAGKDAKVSAVVANAAGCGVVEVNEDAEITGDAGSGLAAISQIKFTAAKTLTSRGKIFANNAAGGVLFDQDGTLKFKGDADHTVEGKTLITADPAGKGTVIVDADVGTALGRKTVKFDGQVGDQADNAGVKKLVVNSRFADLEFTGDVNVHIKELELNGDSTIDLQQAGGTYRFGGISVAQNNTNILKISEDMRLVGAANGARVDFGSAENKLKELQFNADHDLEIGDGINIYATTLTNDAANRGTLKFLGSHTFDAAIGANAINEIELGANDKTVKVVSNMKTNGAITYTGTGTFEFSGTELTVGGTGITPNGNAGKLKFTNAPKTTINAALASGLALVEFAGGDVDYTTNFNHGTSDIKFTAAEAMAVQFNAATTIGNNKVVNETNVEHKITVQASDTFTKAIGSAANGINLELKGGIVATLRPAADEATAMAGARFTSADNNQNEVIMNKAGLKVKALGSENALYSKVTFSENGEVLGDSFSTTTEIANDKSAKFGGRVKGTDVKLMDLDAEAIFASGAKLEANLISVGGNNKGYGTFEGDATITNMIGTEAARLKSVDFTGTDKSIDLANNIHSEAINFGKNKVDVKKDATLNGNTKLASSELILNKNALSATGGGLAFSGDAKVNVSIAQDSSKKLSGGKVTVVSGSTLSYNGTNTLAVQVVGSTLPSQQSTEYTLLDNTAGSALSANDVLVNDKLRLSFDSTSFSKWTVKADEKGSIILTQENNVLEGTKERFKAAGATFTADDQQLLDIFSTGTGDAEQQFIILNGLNNEKSVELLDRMIVNEVNQELEAMSTDATTSVSSHMNTLSAPSSMGQAIETAEGPVSGLAAGDDSSRFGVWGSPFYGKATQKARKGSSGYKSSRFGGSLGFDTKANDDMFIGAALTYMSSDVKHKDVKKGDVTKVNSALLSVYGLQQFTDNWFGQGILTVGTNSVRNTEGRVVSNTKSELAKGKYSSMSFTGELMAGYNYAVQQLLVTPMAGLRLTRVNDGGYKETGTTVSNLSVTKKASNKFEVIAGARLSMNPMEVNGIHVTPELHGFVNFDTVGKNPQVDVRINGSNKPLPTKNTKPQKVSYNVGFGVDAKYGKMEYGAGYDLNLSEKYQAHQGTLKVRVNF